MRSNAGMADRQRGRRLTLRASLCPPVNTLAWLGSPSHSANDNRSDLVSRFLAGPPLLGGAPNFLLGPPNPLSAAVMSGGMAVM